MMHQCLNGSCNEPKQKYSKCLKQRPVSTRNYFLAEKWGMTANGQHWRPSVAVARMASSALLCLVFLVPLAIANFYLISLSLKAGWNSWLIRPPYPAGNEQLAVLDRKVRRTCDQGLAVWMAGLLRVRQDIFRLFGPRKNSPYLTLDYKPYFPLILCNL